MKIFLHIGSHKTGTTAIQDFASQNSDWLLENGLLYPSFDLVGGRRERSHLNLVSMLFRRNLDDKALAAEVLEVAKMRAIENNANILLSAESLFRLADNERKEVTSALSEIFKEHEIIVVCSLRPRAEFAESLYRNSYRAYKKKPPLFDVWLERAFSNFDYVKTVNNYGEDLGESKLILPYTSNTRDRFVVTFFKQLGITITENVSKTVRQKNPSLDVVDCLAKAIILADNVDEKTSRAFNNFCFNSPVSTGYGYLDSAREIAFTKSLSAAGKLLLNYPELASIIGDEVVPLGLLTIDDKCQELANVRADEFRASRTC